MGMSETPPEEAREPSERGGQFGPLVYRLGVVVNTLAWAVGLSPSKVVGVLFFIGFLIFTGTIGAVYWIAKSPQATIADIDGKAFNANPPVPDPVNRVKKPDTTGFVGYGGNPYGSQPRTQASPASSLQKIYLESPDTVSGETEYEPSYGEDPAPPPSRARRRVKKPWPEAKGRGLEQPEWKSEKVSGTSGARMETGGGQAAQGGRFGGMMHAADSAGEGLPGVPELGAGRDVLRGTSDESRIGRGNSRNVGGPVKQEEIPDTGPGVEVSAVDGDGKPTGAGIGTAQRFEEAAAPVAKSGDELKIELNSGVANTIDQAAGIHAGSPIVDPAQSK